MNTNPSSVTAPTSKLKPILIGVVSALILAAILYGVGLRQGRAQLDAQKASYDSQVQTLQSQVATARAELASARNATRLIEARTGFYRTALDLERRNFGIANTRLRESAATLALVKDAGLDAARLSALQKQVAATSINVATDLEAQRRQVLEFAAELEALTLTPPANP